MRLLLAAYVVAVLLLGVCPGLGTMLVAPAVRLLAGAAAEGGGLLLLGGAADGPGYAAPVVAALLVAGVAIACWLAARGDPGSHAPGDPARWAPGDPARLARGDPARWAPGWQGGFAEDAVGARNGWAIALPRVPARPDWRVLAGAGLALALAAVLAGRCGERVGAAAARRADGGGGAPILAGVQAWAQAGWRGKARPPVQQPWRDLVRLWRKAAVAPAGASFLFAAAPGVSLAAAGMAALLVPSFTLGWRGRGWRTCWSCWPCCCCRGRRWPWRRMMPARRWRCSGACGPWRWGRPRSVCSACSCWRCCRAGTNLDAAMAAVRDGGAGARWAGGLAGLALLAGLARDPADAAGCSGRALALAGLARQMRGVVAVALVVAVAAPFGVAPADAGLGAWGVGLACWVLKLGVAGLAAAVLAREPMLQAAGAVLAVIAVAVAAVQGVA